MLLREENGQTQTDDTDTVHTQDSGRPRQKDALLQACSLLAFFMHAKSVPTAAVQHRRRRCVGRVGKGSCFIGKARRVLGFGGRGGSVCRWCRWCVLWSLLGCPFPWLAALHGGRYSRAIRSHPMHHRQPSSPQDRTFSGRNSSLCRALPARFVSSLASRWPGLPGCC